MSTGRLTPIRTAINSQTVLATVIPVSGVKNVKKNPPPPPSWWFQKTGLERRLFIFTGLLVTFLLSLVILLVIANSSNDEENEGSVCLTADCVQAAADLISSMDEGVDPCDDFYQFACGGIQKSQPIPEDRMGIGAKFDQMEDRMKQQFRSIFEVPMAEDEPRAFKLVKNLYKSCMNVSQLEKIGLEPLKNIFAKFGGWPVLFNNDTSSENKENETSWDPDNFNWYDSIHKFRQNGLSPNYFIEIATIPSMVNSSRRSIYIKGPKLGLADEHFLTESPNDQPVYKAYAQYQIEMAILFGAAGDPSKAEKDMKGALEFETRLAEIMTNWAAPLDHVTILELDAHFPSIPWADIFNGYLDTTTGWFDIDQKVWVNVGHQGYIKRFENLIKTTDKRDQANYLFWRAAFGAAGQLNEEARKLRQKFLSVLTGRPMEPARWQECVSVIVNGAGRAVSSIVAQKIIPKTINSLVEPATLEQAVGAMFVRRHFSSESEKESAAQLINNIRSQFYKTVNDTKWMDDETKIMARKKVIHMTSHVGYPVELLDDQKLDDFYKNLHMDDQNFLLNILNLTTFISDLDWTQFGKPINKTDWRRHANSAIVNAWYDIFENSIQIPAGILQPPLFSFDRPAYLNYARIGWIIGHEITHGFDDLGRNFDYKGNCMNWWQPKAKKLFDEHAQCFVAQYGNFSLQRAPQPSPAGDEDGKQDNESTRHKTLGEDIADNGGMKSAYRAYEKWAAVGRNQKNEKRLPGLQKFDPRQLFWLSAATVWCTKERAGASKLRSLEGDHSQSWLRVKGTLSNMAEFARDFNCPMGSGMSPENRCEVW